MKAQDWKKFGNEDFFQVGVAFRRKSKPECLVVNNHICPFILTVQAVAAGRAVTNVLIATRSGGWDFSVVILLVSSAWPWVSRWRRAVTQWQAGWVLVCVGLRCGIWVVPDTARRLCSLPSSITTTNMIICNYSTDNEWLKKFDMEAGRCREKQHRVQWWWGCSGHKAVESNGALPPKNLLGS